MDAAAPRAKRRGGRWRLLPERGTVSLFELVLLAVCVALVAVPLPQYLQDVVIQTFLWAGLALAWNIAGGFAGLISFGHAAFFGIGAYTSSILAANYGLTPWIGLWIGGLLAAALRRGAHARVRAAARAVLHPVDARGRRGGPDRARSTGHR